MFEQNTKAIALLFGHTSLIFITFQSAIKINQFQIWSFLGHFWAYYQGYSLTFLAKNRSFSSLFNLQSKSINFKFGHFWVIFEQNTKAIALLLAQKSLIFITCQSAIKINQFHIWSFLGHFWAYYQGYSLTFLAKNRSFSSLFNLQSKSINFKFGHFWVIFEHTTKAIALLFWPKIAHFHHFSICNQNQSISNLVIFGSFLSKIPRL